MKKLVALLVALVVMCWMAAAMASLEIPKTSSSVKMPMPVEEQPTFKWIMEADGQVQVAMSRDPNLGETFGDGTYFCCELAVVYEEKDSGKESGILFGEAGSSREGDVFSFDIPEGSRYLYTVLMVGQSRERNNEVDNVRLQSDGYIYASHSDDNWFCEVTYEDGKITEYFVSDLRNQETGKYSFSKKGCLETYEVKVVDDYYVTFSVDGTVLEARYHDASGMEAYRTYGWNAEIGWYTIGYDKDLHWYPVPVNGPQAVADPTAYEAPYIRSAKCYTWYPNNTVGVLGLSLRDDLGKTDKWYNVVPVDLTVQGRQQVRLVAANMYYFGVANIDISGDDVTVTYQLPEGHVYLKSESLQWFTSLDEITASFLNNPVGEYVFGEPVSIQDDLNGQDVALLFICNRVTYRQPYTGSGAMLTRYYRGREERVAWRAHLNALLDRLQ